MKIELLKGINTLEELKATYRKLAFKYHPDRNGGNCELMQKLNNEYEYLSKHLKDYKGNVEAEQTAKDFINIINELMRYFENKEEITIELKGTWFWIYGTTFEDVQTREFLKSLNFWWSKKRQCWQYGEGGYSRKDIDVNEINSKYGNKVIKEGKAKSKKQLA